MTEIKQLLKRPQIIQQHIQSSLQSGNNESAKQNDPPRLPDRSLVDESSAEALDPKLNQITIASTMGIDHESLLEV